MRRPKRTKEEQELFKKDLYDLLGVPKNSNESDLKKAYRRLAKKFHPDKARAGSDDEFKKIKGAYDILTDPAMRAEYDKGYEKRPPPSTSQQAEEMFREAQERLFQEQKEERETLEKQHKEEMARMMKKQESERSRLNVDQEKFREMLRKREAREKEREEAEQRAKEEKYRQEAEARRKEAERAQQEAERKEREEAERKRRAESEAFTRRFNEFTENMAKMELDRKKKEQEEADRKKKASEDRRRKLEWDLANEKIGKMLADYLATFRSEQKQLQLFRTSDSEVARMFWELSCQNKEGDSAKKFPLEWITVSKDE